MISENMYNRIYNLLFLEEARLEDNITEKQNYIFRYRPSDAIPYIELIKSQAEYDYFKKYISTFLEWLENFIESG